LIGRVPKLFKVRHQNRRRFPLALVTGVKFLALVDWSIANF